MKTEPKPTEEKEVKVVVIPARIVVDIDETGQEFAYEWKDRSDKDHGEWLNMITEKYVDDEFITRLETDVLYVEFGDVAVMSGPTWREQNSPRFIRVPVEYTQ